MFSTRPLPPLPPFEFVIPMDECASSEDLNSTSSQSSPSPSVFDIKFETPFHMETSGEHDDDLWVSILGDKGLTSNPSNCLPELDSDEGYIDHSSTYSSGVLSPDVDFLGLKSFKEFDYNTHKDLQTPSFQNFDFLEKSPQKTDCLTKISGSDEYAFDECCLLSLPPSPEATNCLDVLFAFPSISDTLQPSRSPYSCEQYANFDKKEYQDTSNYADDFDVSCFEKDVLDSHKMSNDDNTPSNNDALVNADLLNMFFNDNHEMNEIQTRQSSRSPSSANQQSGKSKESSHIRSSAREDHGYAAKLPSCSSNKLKKRGFSREVSRSSNTSSAKFLHINASPSVLEMFLTSNRALDPNKGSNAALANEMRRYERQTGLKSDRLLKKLLTTSDFDRRRNDARH